MTTTRRLVRTHNNAYDTLLLVEGDRVIGAWSWSEQAAADYANPGDLSNWETTNPEQTRIADYGEVVDA